MGQDGDHAPRKPTQDEDGEGRDKEEEILVVPATNAVVYPGTVVIKTLYNRITKKLKIHSGHQPQALSRLAGWLAGLAS